jgi:hypothetical protein
MKRMISQAWVCGLLCLTAGSVLAQSGSATPADTSRSRATAPAKPAVHKARHDTAKKPPAAPLAAAEVLPPLEPELVAVAEQVHLGQMKCELGQTVIITNDEKSPGRFYMHHQRQTYHLTPVVSKTGALRLEDAQKGAVWIQLSNKSMLMNSQLGQRLADECQSPAQAAVAQAMKLAPPINLLEGGRDVARQ